MAGLGTTTDPVELVPGNVSDVTVAAYGLSDYAASLENAGLGLRRISTDDGWRGDAADAFRARYDGQPTRWLKAADSFSAAGQAVDSYALTLSWAQRQAAAAIGQYADGERRTEVARSAFEAQVRRAEDEAAATEAATGVPTAPAYPTWSDPGQADRDAAQHTLDSARSQLSGAGDDTARAVEAASASAPQEPSFWDKVGSGVGDFGEALWHGVQDVSVGTVNALASYGNAMVHHPDEVLMMLGGFMAMAAGGAGEVGGTALDVTGVGAVAGVPINIASAGLIVAGAGLTAAGATALAQNAAGPDSVRVLESRAEQPAPGSAGRRGTPTDRAKEHLTERDLDGARRELNGEVVARKSNGEPWNHVQEVRETQNKLVKRIDQLKRVLADTRVGTDPKAVAQAELSEASRLLEHSKQFVPRP